MVELSDYTAECIIVDGQGRPIRIDVDKAANFIIKDLNVKTILETDEVLHYHCGRYEVYGEKLIDRILVEVFSGTKTSDQREIYNATSTRKEILSRVKAKTYTHLNKFDADLNIINMANGLYDISLGEFRQHDPAYLSRIQIPVEYNATAGCPVIEDTFSIMMREDDLPKVYEFIGYTLWRTYEIQKLFFLLGQGGTGKSYFLDVVNGMVGQNNASSVSLHDLQTDRFASSDLYGKLVNICGDLPATALKETDIIKRLTSNKDIIRAQEKGKPAFDFINYAKLMFSMNKLPRSYDETSGWFRRIEIIPFEHVFTAEEYDEEKLTQLTSPRELSGLFNKIMPYLKGLVERHKFTNETDRTVTAERYKAASNPVEEFVDRYLDEAKGKWVSKPELYNAYSEFCKEHGVEPLTPNKFGSELKNYANWLQGSNPKDSRKISGKSTAVWPNTEYKV
jgi:putative DNA primase/helicase